MRSKTTTQYVLVAEVAAGRKYWTQYFGWCGGSNADLLKRARRFDTISSLLAFVADTWDRSNSYCLDTVTIQCIKSVIVETATETLESLEV